MVRISPPLLPISYKDSIFADVSLYLMCMELL
jgi:hypothetical protein